MLVTGSTAVACATGTTGMTGGVTSAPAGGVVHPTTPAQPITVTAAGNHRDHPGRIRRRDLAVHPCPVGFLIVPLRSGPLRRGHATSYAHPGLTMAAPRAVP